MSRRDDDRAEHHDIPADRPDRAKSAPGAGAVRRPIRAQAAGFGQAAASAARVSANSSGRTRVRATIGMKLVSPPHLGTTCWCRWAAIPAPAAGPWFNPMLKPCGPGHLAQDAHRRLGQYTHLEGFGRAQLGVVADVAVGHHHRVAAVVRIQVEHHVGRLTPRHDQTPPVGLVRGTAERTLVPGVGVGRLVLALDVGHPVRRPEPAELVRVPGVGLGRFDDRPVGRPGPWGVLRHRRSRPRSARCSRAGPRSPRAP